VADFITEASSFLDLLVGLTILGGGLAAAYKFRVLDVLAHRYRSEVWCTSTPVGDEEPGRVLFVGNFVIENTGDRPLKVTRVMLSLLTPHRDDRIIDSDRAEPLVQRQFGSDSGSSWFTIKAGERSIFPLRVYLDPFAGPLIFKCDFEWTHRGHPSEFVWLYDPRLPMTWRSEPTSSPPDAYDPAELLGSHPPGFSSEADGTRT
jgi:hypothetical protein